jgi:hypothetical protein
MRHIIRIFILLILSATSYAQNNYYWVGGSGNWSDLSTHWATTSGGNVFHSVLPRTTDNVIFDPNSFSAANQIVTINVKAECNNMNWTGVTNTPKLLVNNGWNDGLNIYGSLTFVSGMTTEFSVPTFFRATATGKTITMAGKRIMWAYFEGVGGDWTFQDDFYAGEGVFLTNGTLNTNNKAFAAYYFSANNSNVRTLNLGSSAVTLWYGQPWDVRGSNLTYISNGANFTCTNGTFYGGNYNYNDISFSDNGAIESDNGTTYNNVVFTKDGTINGNHSFNNVTFGKNATINGTNTFANLTLGSGSTNTLAASTTQTITGNFVSSSSCTAFTTISSNSTTVPATISKATGSVVLNFASLNNITATGGATFSVTNALNSGTNAGWSVTPAVGRNLYWIGGTGNWGDGAHWSLTSGGAAVNCTPIALDNVFFDANSFSAADQIVTVNVKASCVNMNWTGVTNTPKLRVNNNWSDGLNIYGSLTFVDGMTTEFSVPTFFRATSIGKTITMASKRIMWAYFEGVGGGWTFQDDFYAGEGVFLNNGTLNTNNKAFSAYYFSANNSNIRTLNVGSSLVTLWYGQPWDIRGSNLTYISNGANFNCRDGAFYGGNYNYNDISFSENGTIVSDNGTTYHDVIFAKDGSIQGSHTFNSVSFGKNATIYGNNTYVNLTLGGSANTNLEGNTTQTITGTFASSSSCTGVSNIASTNSNPATISKASGTVALSYVTLNNITGTGGATFTAAFAQAFGTNAGWAISGSAPRNLYWIGGAGNWGDGAHWSLTSGGVAVNCTPNSLDNVFFDVNSFTATGQVVNIDVKADCDNMNWSGVTYLPKLRVYNNWSDGLNIYGSLTFSPSMTTEFGVPTFFRSTATGKTITMNNQRIMWAYFEGVGGGWTLQDNFYAGEGVFLTNGILNTNNKDFSAYYFSANNNNIRTLNIGSSKVTLWYGQPWDVRGNNLTYISNGAKFTCRDGAFYGGNYNYSDISFSENGQVVGDNGTTFHDIIFSKDGVLYGNHTYNNVSFGKNATINGTNTFNDLVFFPGSTNTFEANSTQSINGEMIAVGTGSFPIILTSNGGAAATISKASGTVCMDFVKIQNLTGTGGAAFNGGVLTHSENLGGNTGIVFTGGCTLPLSPLAELSSSKIPPAICGSNTFNYTATSLSPNTTFTWTRPAVNGISNITKSGVGATINEVLMNTTSAPITVTYQITLTSRGVPNTQNVDVLVREAAVVTGVSSLYKGLTTTYTGSGTPASSLVWQSSDPSKATIDASGVLTALNKGYTNVIYTDSRGCFGIKKVLVVVENAMDKIDLPNTNSAAAYSLRLLSSTYTGAAIQVRRSNDDAIMDIGFTNTGNFDQAALLNFVGYNNGYISIWYDQSGFGRDAEQTDVNQQPRIVENGSIETKKGKPTIYFDSKNLATAPFRGYNAGFMFNIVGGVKVNTGGVTFGTKTNGNIAHPIDYYDNAFMVGSGNSYGGWNPIVGINEAAGFSQWTYAGSASTAFAFRNGTINLAPQVPNAYGDRISSLTLATREDRGTRLNGWMSEFVTFGSTLGVANRENIELNQGTYYSITVTSSRTTFTLQPSTSSQTICTGGFAEPLIAIATGLNVTYQWYVNTSATNTGGILLDGAIGSSYTPVITTAGTKYYYVVATGTNGVLSSNVSGAIITTALQAAIITVHPSAATQIACNPTLVTSLQLTATGTGLSYQWYQNEENKYVGATVVTGATANTFTPTSAQTKYYYAIVTNAAGCKTLSGLSGAINVTPAVSTTPSTFGKALNFDGINDHVVVTNNITGTNNFSFNFLMYPTSTSNGKVFSSANLEICVCNNAIEVWTPGGSGSGGTINANQWKKITLVYNNPVASVYIDGVFAFTFNTTSIATGLSSFKIGKHASADCCYFTGLIDEMSFWSKTLNTSEIQSIGTSPLIGSETNLLAYYNFDSTSGSVLADNSGQGHNGLLTNFALSGSNSNWVTNTYSVLAYSNTNYLLDKAGLSKSAAAAYSLRKLSSCYAGFAIQVRRSSDNTTQDIGFTAAGDLDTSALKTFVGVNDGYITKWYDQSGKGKDGVQTNAGNQVRIMSAGIIDMYGNRPALQGLGSQAVELPNGTVPVGNSNYTLTYAINVTGNPGNFGIIGSGDYGAGNRVIAVRTNGNNQMINYWWGNDLYSDVSSMKGTLRIMSNTYNNAIGRKFYDGGVFKNGDGSTGLNNTSANNTLFKTVGGEYFEGKIPEVFIFDELLSVAEREQIESNMAAYYGVSVTTTGTRIALQPSTINQTACLGGSASALYVVANGSNLRYQWYKNTSATTAGATLITGATQAYYSPIETVIGDYYFYVVVTGSDATIVSGLSGKISITNTQAPVITTHPNPASKIICTGATATPLAVVATGTGLTYQWYKSLVSRNFNGDTIVGATTSTYTPPTNVNGASYYYYVIVSNAGGCFVNSNVSGNVAVGTLLDKSGATISAEYAYSLRKLSSCYIGSAIRVRRNSDNQELNIGFDVNGNLDTTALKIFVNADGNTSANTKVGVTKYATEVTTASELVNIYGKLGNGEGVTKYGEAFTVTPPLVPENAFVTVWYDQSGNGNDLTQQQTYWQPQIAFDGKMKYIGARPTLDFNNNKGVFFNNSNQVKLNSVVAILESENDYYNSYHAILDGTNSRLGGLLEYGNTVFHANRYPVSLWRNGSSIATNGSLSPVKQPIIVAYNTYTDMVNGLCIGNYDGGGGGGAAKEAEAIGFASELSTQNRIALEANMAVYYGLTTGIIIHPDTTKQVNCVASTPTALNVVAKGLQLKYQWYSNTIKSNVGGTALAGETSASYVPSSTTPGIKFYYVVVSGSAGADVTSNVSGAINTNALGINISSQPSSAIQSVNQCANASPLTVVATGTDITYKWYYTTIDGNTDGKEIPGATSNSYMPDVAGDYYYYSVLSSLGCSLASNASGFTNILTKPLDLAGLPNSAQPIVAYSVRKVSSCYSGKLIKVRRSSDDTLLDIGFLPSGVLDTVALLTFAGTGNAFVYKWYDQSGRRNDMLQDQNNIQPQIVFNGSIKHIGSRIAVDFAGSKGLVFRGSQISINQVLTAIESENDVYTGYHAMLDGTNIRLGGLTENYNTVFHYNRFPVDLWRNGLSIGGNGSLAPVKNTIICSYTTYTDQVNGLCIGNYDGNNSYGGGAMQSEIFAFPAVLSNADRSAAENNMGAYYGLATRVITQPSRTAQAYCQNTPAQAISIAADGMNTTYQWYSNTANSNTGGTLIAGANSNIYTPVTTAGGTLYYYVVVTGNIGTVTSDASGAVTVTVPTTVISAQPSTAGETVTVCGAVNVTDLSFTATGPTSTYQWYSNISSSNSGGTLLNGATNTSFTPNVEGANYYYAVITTGACTLATNPSGLVRITFSPLDKLGVNTESPAAAFGLRLLTTCYQGKAIKVRRSSDDTMLDIGFKVNGDLDDVALTAFIGSSDGYIVKWYDQSGTGLDAAQSDLTKQPKIATAGVINRENGKPVILYDGTDDYLKLTSWNSRGSDATGFIVFKPTASESNTVALWEFGTNSDASYWAAGGNTIYDGFGTNSRRSVASPIDLDQQTNVATVQIYNYESQYWLNGNPLMTPENVAVDWSGTPTIGGTSNGLRWSGSISELIVYNKAISVIDRQNIEGSEGDYYGVTGTTAILTQPSSINQIYCTGNVTTGIAVLAKGIHLSFQWYSNTTSSNTGGTLIAGATKSTMYPSSATVGSTYYYVAVTGSDGNTVVSNPSGMITINPQPSTGACKDGLTAATAGESGMQLRTDYPAYQSGWYWIKSSNMPNALQMYVDMVEDGGGYDFYIITAGPSVSTVTEVNGGTPLGLDLVMPRSKEHWNAMSKTVLQAITENKAGGGNYDNFFQTAYGVYRSNQAQNGNGNYTNKIMRSKYYGGTNNAPDWRVKDGGRWWLRDDTYGEPNGDYGPNGLLGGGGLPNPYSLGNINFNDLSNNYSTGSFYLVSTNAKK